MKNIMKIQEENKTQFNRFRKKRKKCEVGDLVAIQRTQFDSDLKLKEKYFGPYKVTVIKTNNSYDLEKVGIHEETFVTSSVAKYLKPWVQ